ncbi:MAG: hypothetical protein ACRDHM_03855 [Actinomycetota bacterium]|jgi:hypothetical protein
MDEVEESLQDSIAALEEIAAGVKPPEAWSQLGDVTVERFWQAWPNVRAWGEWLFTLIDKERGEKAEPVSPHDEHEEIGGG